MPGLARLPLQFILLVTGSDSIDPSCMRLKLLFTPPSGRPSGRPLALAALVSAALCFFLLGWSHLYPPAPPPATALQGVGPRHPAPELPDPWPLSLAGEASQTAEGRFRPGTTLAAVLTGADIDSETARRIVAAARDGFDIRRLRAGRDYRIYFDDRGDPLLFRYQADRQTVWLVARTPDGWTARTLTIPFRTRPRYVRAEIHGSLEGSLARTALGRTDAIDVTRKVADLFAWDVDFAVDLRPGDRIDLVLEERRLEDEVAGYGEILAAELTVRGVPFRAVHFEREDGSVSYFTPDGESIRRAFLRSPVPYTRISSRFTRRRYHPILKVNRPHRGVDYVAPPGTAVQATADGVITFAGRSAQAGNYVKIRHGGSYTSWYLHLSRFADRVRVGREVAQGEVIGYVGKTGLATSHHLHYQLSRSDGTFVDPLRVQFPAADPVPAQDRALFVAQRDRWMGLLEEGKRRVTVQMAGGGS